MLGNALRVREFQKLTSLAPLPVGRLLPKPSTPWASSPYNFLKDLPVADLNCHKWLSHYTITYPVVSIAGLNFA